MICLGDMPKISTEIYNFLIKSFINSYVKNKPLIIIPTYQGNYGNPIIFSKYFFSELKKLNGDKGAKDLIKSNLQYTKLVNISKKSILEDIDDVEAYKTLIKHEK